MTFNRIGVIGDVHCEDALLETALRRLASMHLDALLCTGDICTGPGDVNRCCDLLQEYDVLTVRGNHDRWFLGNAMGDLPQATEQDDVTDATRAYLASLPPTREFDTPHGRLLLCHGLGDDDMTGVRPGDYGYALESNHRLHALAMQADYRYVVNGHTHQRMVRRFEGTTIVNAGTLAHHRSSVCAAIDLVAGVVDFYGLLVIGERQTMRMTGD